MTTFDSTTAAAASADDHAQQSQAQPHVQQPQQQSAAAAHAAGKQKAGHFLSVNAALGDAFGTGNGNGNGERQSSTDLLARDMKTSSAASSAAPSRATSRATTPVFGALELGAVVMVESPQTSARSSSTNSANGGLGSGQFEAKRPAPIVIVKDEEVQQAMAGPDGVLKIRALRTDGSARLDDDKEVPSVDIDSRLYAQSPHPSAIPILSRQSSKGYNLGTEQSEVKLQTQGFDPLGLFSPTAAGHAQAMAVKARAVAIADLDAQGKHFDSRGRARTNSNAAAMAGKAKAVQKEAEDGGCRDCAGCTLM